MAIKSHSSLKCPINLGLASLVTLAKAVGYKGRKKAAVEWKAEGSLVHKLIENLVPNWKKAVHGAALKHHQIVRTLRKMRARASARGITMI